MSETRSGERPRIEIETFFEDTTLTDVAKLEALEGGPIIKLLPDVNVLIYAHREDAPEHRRYAAWLRTLTAAPEPFALSEVVLAGFLRIVTLPQNLRPTRSHGDGDRVLPASRRLATRGRDCPGGPALGRLRRTVCEHRGAAGHRRLPGRTRD